MTESESAQLRLVIIRHVADMPADQLLQVRDQLGLLCGQTAESMDAWMSLSDAASETGLSPGHLRRRCAIEWQFGGMAKRVRTASGGVFWFVKKDVIQAIKQRAVSARRAPFEPLEGHTPPGHDVRCPPCGTDENDLPNESNH